MVNAVLELPEVQEERPAGEHADGDEEQSLTKRASVSGGRPRVALFNTRTHEKILVAFSNVREALKKKHQDEAYPEWLGKGLFSRTQNGVRVLGQSTCFLHPSRPERVEYDRLGLPPCQAAHLASDDQVMAHMQARHPSAWKRLSAIREEARRKEERELQLDSIRAFKKVAVALGRKK